MSRVSKPMSLVICTCLSQNRSICDVKPRRMRGRAIPRHWISEQHLGSFGQLDHPFRLAIGSGNSEELKARSSSRLALALPFSLSVEAGGSRCPHEALGATVSYCQSILTGTPTKSAGARMIDHWVAGALLKTDRLVRGGQRVTFAPQRPRDFAGSMRSRTRSPPKPPPPPLAP